MESWGDCIKRYIFYLLHEVDGILNTPLVQLSCCAIILVNIHMPIVDNHLLHGRGGEGEGGGLLGSS